MSCQVAMQPTMTKLWYGAYIINIVLHLRGRPFLNSQIINKYLTKHWNSLEDYSPVTGGLLFLWLLFILEEQRGSHSALEQESDNAELDGQG